MAGPLPVAGAAVAAAVPSLAAPSPAVCFQRPWYFQRRLHFQRLLFFQRPLILPSRSRRIASPVAVSLQVFDGPVIFRGAPRFQRALHFQRLLYFQRPLHNASPAAVSLQASGGRVDPSVSAHASAALPAHAISSSAPRFQRPLLLQWSLDIQQWPSSDSCTLVLDALRGAFHTISDLPLIRCFRDT